MRPPLRFHLFACLVLVVFLSVPAWAISHRTLLAPTGAAAFDQFGWSVGTAGDVNGDGYADVIVGATRNDAGGTDAGQAYVYYGGPGADATADLTLAGAAAGDQFGISVGTAGDVNGDGYADVIVGATMNDAGGTNAGQAYVYYGGPGADTTADLTLTGAAALDQFGFSVGTAGDVNGDDYADVIVGARANDEGPGPDAGRAYVYYGGPAADATADLTLTGTAAGDLFGTSVGTAGDVNGDGYADVIVGASKNNAGGTDAGRAYVYYGGPAADATADLTLTGTAAGDDFGISVGTAGDVNGDGYADVIVGAEWNDAGGTDAGQAYVYYGGLSADLAADLTLPGAEAMDTFGYSVGTAGDVNGDGYADVIVGMASNFGQACVYYGGPSADATADVTLWGDGSGEFFGRSVGTAGDVNGDGYADVIVGAYASDAGGADAGRAYVTAMYPYQVASPNGGEQWVAGSPATVRWLGHDVADVGISLDGGLSWSTLAAGIGGLEENELTLPAPSIATEFARVRLSYTGQIPAHSTSDASDAVFSIVLPEVAPAAACRAELTVTGVAFDDFFGSSVGTAGDMNGDGYPDVIVGARGNDAGGTDAGRAYVYYQGPGTDATADLTLTGAAAFDNFGSSAGTAGDVNGDGYADVVVGARLSDAGGADAGRAYVYHGGPGADATADLTLTGAAVADQFGISVGTAGDVNGDGYADVIVGASANDAGGTDAGQAYVYYGGMVADAFADLTLTGAVAADNFGSSVGTAGDVNGDGHADVIVGARLNDAGGVNAGRAYVYYGGPAADATVDLTLTGTAAGDQFGFSVGTAGDVNGDGYADVIVGAFANDAGGTDAGRAYVYYGGPSADATADLTLTGAAGSDNFGRSVGTAGDVNRDGYADVIVGAFESDAGGIDAGRAYMFYGGPLADATADLTLTGAAAGGHFGVSVATAGDVNRDGYADVIIGARINDAGGSEAGWAYVYHCNRYFVLSPNGGETWNVGALTTVSWLGAEPADVSLSADGGASFELLERGVGGRESNVLSLRVPHQPTRFAQIRVTPSDLSVDGSDKSDSLFTVQASIALLQFAASPPAQGAGALLTWGTDPGPENLSGYRLEKSASSAAATDGGWRMLVASTRETSYLDADGKPGERYRLTAINGLGEEYVLGEATFGPAAPLAAWPLPYRGGDLAISFATVGGFGGGTGPAALTLHDVTGRRVCTVARGAFAAGYQRAAWDGCDDAGRRVASGVYFLRLTTGGEMKTFKIMVLR